ncbi:SMI1/KNR4 family protein [Paenibacillus sp. L3-i20]|uniref:SMI1/KNR4 family protein n=1 Tax=Paenibacillus sp. L3-i20 TaxID=2905833 RepID=UPI001EDCDEBC|nr:SMI1/KNR4 family protein [Paenibacillus sp. L3-i20]GKU77212.1 hypothetical protein L3i20_v216090 [Paenibacillus sp. L3-i20]
MNNKIVEFIIWAQKNGWDIVEKSSLQFNLDHSIISRYKEIPHDYLDFLSRIEKCVAPNEMTWFICENEFNNRSDIAFKWNEYELLSLEAAMDDDSWRAEITTWWNNYMPIVMSVDGGYSFYAIDVTNDKGAIVRGYEPEFEEVEKVSNTLEEFFDLMMSSAIEGNSKS